MGLWKERTSSTVERCVKNQVKTHFFHWTELNHIRFNSSPVSSSAVEHLPSTRVGETSPGENTGNFKARLCGSLHRGASTGFQGFHARFCPIIHCTDSSWILWYGLSVNYRFILKLKALYLFNIRHHVASFSLFFNFSQEMTFIQKTKMESTSTTTLTSVRHGRWVFFHFICRYSYIHVKVSMIKVEWANSIHR